MSLNDLLANLTGERALLKYTNRAERPSRDEISRLAYHLYETRGRRDGQDLDDWLTAEQELNHHYR